MRNIVCKVALALALAHGVAAAHAATGQKGEADLARGRYLVKIGGCNDCHTVGWPETAGAVPEQEWLTGSPVGFQGPWGTTYPANLRISMGSLTEQQWMASARKPLKPPMPWFALRDMTDTDLRAIYRFVKSLGPAGKPAPHYVPPGGNVTTPVIVFPAPPSGATPEAAKPPR